MCLCVKLTLFWFHARWEQLSASRSISVRVSSRTNYIRNDSRGNESTNVVHTVNSGRTSLVDWCICNNTEEKKQVSRVVSTVLFKMM